jgi:1-acyl-sn-glycerol-3-phosphate acyltransferase
MADAKTSPIVDDRNGRGSRAVLAGADRATGERERRRRRTTPLLSGSAADGAPPPERPAATGNGADPTPSPAPTDMTAPTDPTTPTDPTATDGATDPTAPTVPDESELVWSSTSGEGSGPVTPTAATKQAGTKRAAATRKTAPATKAAATKAAATKAAPAKKASARKATKKAAAAKVPVAKPTAAQESPAEKVAIAAAAANTPAARKAAKRSAATKAATKAAPAVTKAAAKVASAPAPVRPTPPRPPARTAAKQGSSDQARPRIAPARNPNKLPRLPRTTTSGEPVVPLRRPAATVTTSGRPSLAVAVAKQAGEALLEAVTSRARPADVEARVGDVLSFLKRRLTGEYDLDEFGFDPEFTEAVPLALLKPLYDHWFRVEVRGIENIPAEGGALVVANHSGGIPIDAVMTAVAVHTEHPQKRFMRALGADLVFQLPFVAGLARRSGVTLATNPDAERLLSGGHVVGVWPEGFKGIGKPFSERYKLQRFGRGGFVSAALRTGTPIIPCSIVGAEEIYPIISDLPSLARLLGLPYVPVTPFFPWLGPLGAIPLPSKWLIEFGPPVPTDEYGPKAAEDPMLVFDLTDQVRQSIQQTLYSLLVQRRSIFF